MTPLTIALTGATGRMGAQIRPLLAERGHRVILISRTDVADAAAGEEVRVAQLSDIGSLAAAFDGADLVVHLSGNSGENTWESMLAVNIDGTRNVLEAARETGVSRVLLASSCHAVGMLSYGEVRGVVEPRPAPDTYYGFSKAAVEALGRVYASRFGMLVVSARIGTAWPQPLNARMLYTWLSPADTVRLIEATGTTTAQGGHVVWAVSANSGSPLDLTAGRAIDFHPQDDAALYADTLEDRTLPADSDLIGGVFTTDDYPVGEVELRR